MSLFVSLTRLRLRSFKFFPGFFWYTARSAWQARRTPGNRGVRTRRTQGLTFWTLSGWDSGSSMMTFRNATPHVAAMRKLPNWCDEASYVHWQEENDNLPNWTQAAHHLATSGRLSKVNHPSADQAAGRLILT